MSVVESNAVIITCTDVAPGVVRFHWVAGADRGDGLLVDADVASNRWCEVADVLVRSVCALRVARPEDWATVLAQVVAQYRASLGERGGATVAARRHGVNEAALVRMRSARGSSTTA